MISASPIPHFLHILVISRHARYLHFSRSGACSGLEPVNQKKRKIKEFFFAMMIFFSSSLTILFFLCLRLFFPSLSFFLLDTNTQTRTKRINDPLRRNRARRGARHTRHRGAPGSGKEGGRGRRGGKRRMREFFFALARQRRRLPFLLPLSLFRAQRATLSKPRRAFHFLHKS